MIARNENLGNDSKLCKNMEIDRKLKHEEHDIDKMLSILKNQKIVDNDKI